MRDRRPVLTAVCTHGAVTDPLEGESRVTRFISLPPRRKGTRPDGLSAPGQPRALGLSRPFVRCSAVPRRTCWRRWHGAWRHFVHKDVWRVSGALRCVAS